MILIVGTPELEHAAYVYEKLTDKGESPVYINTYDFPANMAIAFSADTPMAGYIKPAGLSHPIALRSIRSVYWRYGLDYTNINSIDIADPFVRGQVYQEILSGLGSFFNGLECLFVDPLAAFERQFYKSYQLKQFKAAGIRIPDSIVTNDVAAVYGFFEKHHKKVIYKSCWALAKASRLEESDLYSGRFENLRLSPVNFQQWIEGTDLLAYVLNGEVFAVRVVADTLDFRVAKEIGYEPITLPDEIVEQCLTVSRLMGSNFLLLDLRCTPEGEYVFFDGTPSPKFMEVEAATGYPLCQRLVDLLIAGRTGE